MNNGKMDLTMGGKGYSLNGGRGIDELIKEQAIKEHNDAIDKHTAAMNAQLKTELEKAQEVTEKMSTMEIMPINTYVLVKPYSENPYQKIEVTDSGLIIPEFKGNTVKNQQTGEMEQEVNFTVVARVIEASPLCKFVKEGDDVYYRIAAGVPVPFFRQGMEVVAESSIQIVINEGLKQRFLNGK